MQVSLAGTRGRGQLPTLDVVYRRTSSCFSWLSTDADKEGTSRDETPQAPNTE